MIIYTPQQILISVTIKQIILRYFKFLRYKIDIPQLIRSIRKNGILNLKVCL